MQIKDHHGSLLFLFIIAFWVTLFFLFFEPVKVVKFDGIAPMTLASARDILDSPLYNGIRWEQHQRTKGRTPFFIVNLPAGPVASSVKQTGELEASVGTAIHRELASFDISKSTVLDVGEGNVGFFALACASLGSRVTAIEAIPFYAALIRVSMHLNPRFEDLITLFNVQPDTTPLDTVLQQYLEWPVSLAKVDVEGFELQVLKGAATLLSSPKAPCTVIVKLNPDLYMRRKQPWSSQELCAYMATFGYIVYRIGGLETPYPDNTVDFNEIGGAYLDLVFRNSRPLKHCIRF